MATTVENANRDPQGTQSYNYHSSGNTNPGGTTATVSVTPSDRRITGKSTSGQAQRDSISRQYGQDRTAVAAA